MFAFPADRVKSWSISRKNETFNFARNRISPMSTNSIPTVTFWGAARTVTGSMHLVEANGVRFLLDCGLYQGKRAEARQRNSHFPFLPKSIDAVILSHAHLDHCGNLPNLV